MYARPSPVVCHPSILHTNRCYVAFHVLPWQEVVLVDRGWILEVTECGICEGVGGVGGGRSDGVVKCQTRDSDVYINNYRNIPAYFCPVNLHLVMLSDGFDGADFQNEGWYVCYSPSRGILCHTILALLSFYEVSFGSALPGERTLRSLIKPWDVATYAHVPNLKQHSLYMLSNLSEQRR